MRGRLFGLHRTCLSQHSTHMQERAHAKPSRDARQETAELRGAAHLSSDHLLSVAMEGSSILLMATISLATPSVLASWACSRVCPSPLKASLKLAL